jgi:Tfp pilus assembly protein PilN
LRAINLIPAEQRRGAGGIAGRTGGIVYVVLAALVALVVMGVIYAVTVHQVASRKTTLAQITQEGAAVEQQVASLQPYVSFQTLAEERIQGVASLAAQRFDWPLAMAQIALALPSNVTLTTLSGVAAGGAPAAASGASGASGTTGTTGSTTPSAVGATVNSPQLAVAGCATGSASRAQDTVATTLARFRALLDVSAATVSTYTTAGCAGVTFAMTITYNNEFGIPPVKLKTARDTTVGG